LITVSTFGIPLTAERAGEPAMPIQAVIDRPLKRFTVKGEYAWCS